MIGERDKVIAEELSVLSKFDGEPLPENEVERVYIKNGKIVATEYIQDGEIVSRVESGGDSNAGN